MAQIEKRGEGYRITVSNGRRADGSKILHRITYIPTAKGATAQAREVQKQAALFEVQVKKGLYFEGERIRFSEYVKTWKTYS